MSRYVQIQTQVPEATVWSESFSQTDMSDMSLSEIKLLNSVCI